MEIKKRTVILPITEYQRLIIENNELLRIDGRISDVNKSIKDLQEDIHYLNAKVTH